MIYHRFEGEAQAFGRNLDIEYDGDSLIVQGISIEEAYRIIRGLENKPTITVLKREDESE